MWEAHDGDFAHFPCALNSRQFSRASVLSRFNAAPSPFASLRADISSALAAAALACDAAPPAYVLPPA